MGPSWRLGRGGEFELLLRSRRPEQDELTVDRGGRTTLVGGAAGVLGGGLVASMTRNVLVLLLVLALAAPAGADLCTANVGGSPVACNIRKPDAWRCPRGARHSGPSRSSARRTSSCTAPPRPTTP